MKIKLNLSTLESRENPSASPFDAPAGNEGLYDVELFYSDATATWHGDTNPMPAAPVTTLWVTELMNGSSDSVLNPTQVSPIPYVPSSDLPPLPPAVNTVVTPNSN